MKTEEKTLETGYVYNGRILNLRNDKVELPNGKIAYREVIEHNGAVCIVAVDEDENTYLVSQYRYPFKTDVLEVPAGKLEKNEDPLACAVRELKEETGFSAEQIQSLGELLPSPGYSAEKIYMFLATGLSKGEQSLDEDEFLNVVKMPLEEVVQQIMDGSITDSKTIASVLKVAKLYYEG